MTTKENLKSLGLKQTWLLARLRDRGFKSNPGELSSILSGTLVTPKAQTILAAADEIIREEVCNR